MKLKPIILDLNIYDKPNLRNIFTGILYRLKTGYPWRYLPECFGKYNTVLLNLQSKCNKKRSTHQLEYNFVSTQKPFPNDEYFLPTSYNKRARKDNDFTRTGQKTSRNCQSTGT
ncbi:transposase [Glaesserella parasuis]|uniref:transposase n=1 Tax=Glaesserella parasuis TaxID=738 RepID=UPI0039FD38FF